MIPSSFIFTGYRRLQCLKVYDRLAEAQKLKKSVIDSYILDSIYHSGQTGWEMQRLMGFFSNII